AAVREALASRKGKTVALVYESATNPLIDYTDTRAIARIAHEFGVPVIVDNTFLTPYLQQPMRMGADIVVHSMTKYMSGRGDMLAGAAVGPRTLVHATRHFQEVTGAVFQTPELMGRAYERLRTLGPRMELHVRNAATLADFLRTMRACAYVSEVKYPTLGKATRHGSPGAVMCFVMAGQDDNERQRRGAGLMQYVLDHGGDTIHHMVSLGDGEHLLFGETTNGLLKDPSFPAGLVRFAVGRTPDADRVKDFFGKAFEHVYRSR
ncbi:MAG TPA: PLP-dependent transferase, partial [Candidatus Nanoarchaeia archaeon]|nr:PLP-dependent transferase [Candidatus Nanoarchaeia archaeon]